ncbi:DUF7344 domain-containing protein [Halegenticoccus soli]|uniref:DUF7344 domain-containing protein n=1 Tax=Halegenticoccus soli TaxID=1985678 RepID=UPI000C6E7586|nr:hypothetical protein [Halegenticoccus soli]
MGDRFSRGEGASGRDLFGAVASHRRRRVLALLTDRTSPVPLADLATQLVAREEDKELLAVTREEQRRALVDLAQTQLPKLEDAGLVARDAERRTVAATDHPAFRDPAFAAAVDTHDPSWDPALSALANPRRRAVLSVLRRRREPVDRRELAALVAARTGDRSEVSEGSKSEEAEREGAGSEETRCPTEDERHRILVSLHHVHLPKLRRAGIVEYDAERETVAYRGHPALTERWLDAEPGESPRTAPSAEGRSDEIRTIEGREDVVAHGQSLFDRADEELFLMITTDGLLEEECIARLEDAVDRGVDVYLGSQTPEVRDLVRERTPDVTIWEPQTDWLNLPPTRERVGRLVFVDREALMLGTLGEEGAAGVPRETAIAGEGADNAFVVLMREMLGPRLDHLDAQSEDFLSQIPL